jgi:hypothetical protein
MVWKRSSKGAGSWKSPAASADRERGILTRVNADGLRALKLLAIERDTTLQALSVEALNDMLAKHGRRRTVKTPPGKRD